ncbi:hypothetical protein AHMF7605_00670 [Adhaeribacter arboris]|uniref:DUF4468 domain-containing protein n=1 Tax=Adhaeribacter arboris TaxID=2072846 RepID=A0A2T2Y9N4_9BACT|nr:hypothetical protein [Adhaeribacter arboris]PSR52138.1 hypothetical protein AHMF7605_00670 [Adhaeribacter arboris]
MKKFKRLTGIILFTFLAIHANAQKFDIVITFKGDTLAGTIIGERFTSLKFKDLTGTKFEKLSSNQVQEYRTNKKIFNSKNVPGEAKPLFLQRLEAGSIALYEYYKRTGATGNTYIIKWYVSKNDEPLIELKTNWGATIARKERKAAFEELLKDDSELYNQYLSFKSFNYDTLRSFINKYNNRAQLSSKVLSKD